MNLAERARDAVLGRLGAAAESGLLDLVSSDMAEEEWLRAVVQHGESGDDSDARSVDDFRRAPRWRVIAILLLEDSEARKRDSAMR
jgi:hypothetical protein